MNSTQDKPRVSFLLALLGGVFVTDAGFATALLSALEAKFVWGSGLDAIGSALNLLGFVWGLLIIACAILLRARPQRHARLGLLIIILGSLAFITSYVGFLLSIGGGMFAIAWRPPKLRTTPPGGRTDPPVHQLVTQNVDAT